MEKNFKKNIMKEIYELRKNGKTWKEIQAMLKNKSAIPTLTKALKKWCQENNEQFIDSRKGNKRAGRPKKQFELQESIMQMHAQSGKFGK
jgi:hypothetical protein